MVDARPALTYRMATAADLELLCRFRVECGWGEPRVREKLLDPDYPMCVFEADVGGAPEPIGMGGWILEADNWASRETGWVHLSALFISQKYQGSGYGGRALDLLEAAAVDVFNATYVTLSTSAYNHVVAPDGRSHTEDRSADSRNVQWYKRRGYEVYNGPESRYPLPDDPVEAKVISAVDLKKSAATIARPPPRACGYRRPVDGVHAY